MPRKKKVLRNNIRKLRFYHDEMTQVELGRKLGCSGKMISALEKGRTIPNLLRAYKIADYFSVPLEEVYYFEEIN
jgi:putative transcriptional regulator